MHFFRSGVSYLVRVVRLLLCVGSLRSTAGHLFTLELKPVCVRLLQLKRVSCVRNIYIRVVLCGAVRLVLRFCDSAGRLRTVYLVEIRGSPDSRQLL